MTGGTEDGADAIPIPAQTPLYYALQRPRYDRQDLIRQIQNRTGRRLICYVTGPAASISTFDYPPFVDLLHDVQRGDDLDLLLHTPGGDVDQAERIVLLCRKTIGPDATFRVVVPDSAKSAGTLIAIASDEIVMGLCSELGPIDPQIEIVTPSGERMIRPAQSYLDGLKEIVSEVGEGRLSPAYFPLLDKLDPALLDFCNKALARSEQFAERFLKRHMLKDDPERARQVAKKLNSASDYLSHGAVIDSQQAIEMGLNVRDLRSDDDCWQAFWRLYCEARLALEGPFHRLFEGERASLLVQG